MPKVSLQAIYLYWHCGDEAEKIPPMKFFSNSDVRHLGKTMRVRLGELRKVMKAIDTATAAKGHPVANNMTHAMANTCFFHGESAISDVVPATTNTGRDRIISRMKWNTIVKYTCTSVGVPKVVVIIMRRFKKS